MLRIGAARDFSDERSSITEAATAAAAEATASSASEAASGSATCATLGGLITGNAKGGHIANREKTVVG